MCHRQMPVLGAEDRCQGHGEGRLANPRRPIQQDGRQDEWAPWTQPAQRVQFLDETNHMLEVRELFDQPFQERRIWRRRELAPFGSFREKLQEADAGARLFVVVELQCPLDLGGIKQTHAERVGRVGIVPIEGQLLRLHGTSHRHFHVGKHLGRVSGHGGQIAHNAPPLNC